MEVEEFLKEAAVMKEVKHPNLVQLLGQLKWTPIIGLFFILLILLIRIACSFNGTF